MIVIRNHASLIWGTVEVLRGVDEHEDHGSGMEMVQIVSATMFWRVIARLRVYARRGPPRMRPPRNSRAMVSFGLRYQTI